MFDEPAYLGLLPLIPYAIVLWLSYRMLHHQSGGFWIWIGGWLGLVVFTVTFAVTRLRTVLLELMPQTMFDPLRWTLIMIGSLGLLVFVLALRWSLPTETTVWQDVRTDTRRVWRWVQGLWHRGG